MSILRKFTLKYLRVKGYDVCNLYQIIQKKIVCVCVCVCVRERAHAQSCPGEYERMCSLSHTHTHTHTMEYYSAIKK